jgi:hypothetical protein
MDLPGRAPMGNLVGGGVLTGGLLKVDTSSLRAPIPRTRAAAAGGPWRR